MRLVESNRVDNNIINNLIESEKKVIKEANEYTFTYGNDKNIIKGSDNPAFKDKYKVIINGKEIKPGDKIKDFRGEEHIFKGVTNPGTTFGGMNGKIVVTHGDGEMEYYPSVFDAKLEKINEAAKPKKGKKEEEEVSFDEIVSKMEVAESYEDLYNAVALIKNDKLRSDAEDCLDVCQRDGDDVDTAYSVCTSCYIDYYCNNKNVKNLDEAVNNKSYNKTFNESYKISKKKNLKEPGSNKNNKVIKENDDRTLEYRRSEFSKIPLKDGSYKIKILSATSETKYLDITEKEFASIERLLTTKE